MKFEEIKLGPGRSLFRELDDEGGDFRKREAPKVIDALSWEETVDEALRDGDVPEENRVEEPTWSGGTNDSMTLPEKAGRWMRKLVGRLAKQHNDD